MEIIHYQTVIEEKINKINFLYDILQKKVLYKSRI